MAATNLPGPAGSPTLGCANLVTCANGKIDDTNDNESILAWHQLARAGFLIGNYDGLGTVSSATNAPTNPFGGYLQLIFDNAYSDVSAPAPALNIKTGGNIPSPLVAELDRKLDDGEPQTGAFRFSSFDGSTASCITGAPVKHNASLNITTCGGAQLQ